MSRPVAEWELPLDHGLNEHFNSPHTIGGATQHVDWNDRSTQNVAPLVFRGTGFIPQKFPSTKHGFNWIRNHRILIATNTAMVA